MAITAIIMLAVGIKLNFLLKTILIRFLTIFLILNCLMFMIIFAHIIFL